MQIFVGTLYARFYIDDQPGILSINVISQEGKPLSNIPLFFDCDRKGPWSETKVFLGNSNENGTLVSTCQLCSPDSIGEVKAAIPGTAYKSTAKLAWHGHNISAYATGSWWTYEDNDGCFFLAKDALPVNNLTIIFNTSNADVKILDNLGNPKKDIIVIAISRPNLVALRDYDKVWWGRTDDTGIVIFPNLTPERFYFFTYLNKKYVEIGENLSTGMNILNVTVDVSVPILALKQIKVDDVDIVSGKKVPYSYPFVFLSVLANDSAGKDESGIRDVYAIFRFLDKDKQLIGTYPKDGNELLQKMLQKDPVNTFGKKFCGTFGVAPCKKEYQCVGDLITIGNVCTYPTDGESKIGGADFSDYTYHLLKRDLSEKKYEISNFGGIFPFTNSTYDAAIQRPVNASWFEYFLLACDKNSNCIITPKAEINLDVENAKQAETGKEAAANSSQAAPDHLTDTNPNGSWFVYLMDKTDELIKKEKQKKPKLKLVFVPINWNSNDLKGFNDSVEEQTAFFFDRYPIGNCKEKVKIIKVNQSCPILNWTCGSDYCSVNGMTADMNAIRQCALNALGITGIEDNMYVIGLTKDDVCGAVSGQSCRQKVMWSQTDDILVTSHELGHEFYLTEEYNSLRNGPPNQLSVKYGCDPANSTCCFDTCIANPTNVCCYGNLNPKGGRCIMSYSGAQQPRYFDPGDILFFNDGDLSVYPRLSQIRCQS